MDYILKKYLPRVDFESYEDFKAGYKVNVPDNFNFGFDVVDDWANNEPDKRALVWCNDHEGDTYEEYVFTFTDIKRRSNQMCNYFKSLGIRKGDRVMLIMKRRYEYWITVTALHKLGAVVIPATFQLTEKDLIYRINAANVKMIVCAPDEYIIDHVENSQDQCPSLQYKALVIGEKLDKAQMEATKKPSGIANTDIREGWLNYCEGYLAQSDVYDRPVGTEDDVMSEDLMIIYFTSGTTGMPKMVQHIQSYPLGHIVTAKYWQCVEENGLHLTVADSGWAKFSWGKIYGQWISGSAVLGYDHVKFDAFKLLKVMSHFKITTFCAPATMYRFMIKEDIEQFDFSYLHHCCMAGEPLNPEVFNQWERITGHKLYEGFGQTEGPVLLANFKWITPKPGSTGKPTPAFDIKLCNSEGKDCEIGEEGEIVICDAATKRLTGLTIGYASYDNSALFARGDYHTGDNAWFDEDGYYWFIGRVDDVIKCSGYRIGPFEVESAIMTHPSVLECAVTAAPDPVRGQVVKATIVLARGYEPSEELKTEIKNHVKRVTAPYKYPRIIDFVDELPKTTSGKIKRNVLRQNSK